MIIETYNIDKTTVNIDDSFFLVTENEKDNRISIFNNFSVSLIQKVNIEEERKI